MKYSTLHKGDDLQLTICVCYSLEMAINVIVSFDMQGWKGIWEEAEVVNSAKPYAMNDDMDVMLVFYKLIKKVCVVAIPLMFIMFEYMRFYN
jgi:hypothetical protein